MRQRAREVLFVLLDFCDDAGDVECEPSLAEIARAARMSVRSAQRALRDLEACAHIATHLRVIRARFNDTNRYIILPSGGALLDLPRSLRAESVKTPPSLGVTAPSSLHDLSGNGLAFASDSKSLGSGPASPCGRGAARPALSKFAELVRAEVLRADEEAERTLDMIGRPWVGAGDEVAGAGEAGAAGNDDADILAKRSDDDGSTTSPVLDSTSPAQRVQEGGAPPGGAVAPSEINNLSGDRSRAGARMSLSKPRAAVVARLLAAGLGEIAKDGYEERLVRICSRERVNDIRLIEAVENVCRRRAEDILAGGERAVRWSKTTWEIRPYLYRSVQNEVREQKEARERARELADRRRRRTMCDMQEASLGKVGAEILAELRKHDVLLPVATVDLAHRLAGRCSAGVSGGRLSMEDILHTIRGCAENERDKVAVGQGRPAGHIATYVRSAVDQAQPGCAKQKKGGGRSGGWSNERGYAVQKDAADETWEW